MVDTLVRGVLHPPRTKEIPSSGADAIRPRRGDSTGIFQWKSSIEIRSGITVVGGENAIQRHSADGWRLHITGILNRNIQLFHWAL